MLDAADTVGRTGNGSGVTGVSKKTSIWLVWSAGSHRSKIACLSVSGWPCAVFLLIHRKAQIPLCSSHLDTTRLDTFDVSCPCILAGRTERLVTLDTTSLTGLDTQLSLLCNLYKVMVCKLFTNLLEYTLILFNVFHLTEQIGFVYM